MAQRKVGAAVVIDPDSPGPGIITERDLMESIGAGQDPDVERVGDHLTAHLVFAAPEWSLEEAAVAMVRGGFRHLVVTEGGDIAGVALDARHRALLDRRRRDLRRPGVRRPRARVRRSGTSRSSSWPCCRRRRLPSR